MKKSTLILILVSLVVLGSILFFVFTRKKAGTTSTKTAAQPSQEIQLSADENPYISLIPRADGHNLTLKVTGIPSKFTSVDYELIYTAQDQDLQIEKGVSGTVKPADLTAGRDLLLGTASCTNGCKYKYDDGVTGGTLNLTLTTDNQEFVSFSAPFALKSSADLNKDKKIALTEENFVINGTVTSKKDYFVAIKNFKSIYSVFSSGDGKGKITSIEPNTITKKDLSSFIGDYTAQ